ncbi:MAG: hypothetical protein ACM3PU_16590 [Gemmatimonadota bacterium]
MNTELAQDTDRMADIEVPGEQLTLVELNEVELAYVGGGMANVAFM